MVAEPLPNVICPHCKNPISREYLICPRCNKALP